MTMYNRMKDMKENAERRILKFKSEIEDEMLCEILYENINSENFVDVSISTDEKKEENKVREEDEKFVLQQHPLYKKQKARLLAYKRELESAINELEEDK
eukprot:g445.t1